MYAAQYKGVWFVEGMPNGCRLLGPISTEINEAFGQSQLKSLDDVKERMVGLVHQMGGNAVVNFKYGQRSSFWKSLWGVDNVWWYGSGQIAVIQ
jgi:hypothetical protein